MNQIQQQLLREIEVFCRQAKMSKSAFGLLCANDGKLVARLSTSSVTTNTVEKIEAYIAQAEAHARADQLLRDIEAFCGETKMAETTFGRLAANNAKLVARLRYDTVPTDIIEKAEAFLAERRAEQRPEQGAGRRKPDEPQLGV